MSWPQWKDKVDRAGDYVEYAQVACMAGDLPYAAKCLRKAADLLDEEAADRDRPLEDGE